MGRQSDLALYDRVDAVRSYDDVRLCSNAVGEAQSHTSVCFPHAGTMMTKANGAFRLRVIEHLQQFHPMNQVARTIGRSRRRRNGLAARRPQGEAHRPGADILEAVLKPDALEQAKITPSQHLRIGRPSAKEAAGASRPEEGDQTGGHVKRVCSGSWRKGAAVREVLGVQRPAANMVARAAATGPTR